MLFPRCLEPKLMTQFPEVSALGLGGFVFGNGDKLGAAVRGLRTGWGNWWFWWMSELVMVNWLGWIGYSGWLVAMVWSCCFLFVAIFVVVVVVVVGGGVVWDFHSFFFPRESVFFLINSKAPAKFAGIYRRHIWDFSPPPFESLEISPFFCGWSWDGYQHSVLNLWGIFLPPKNKHLPARVT